MLPYQYIIWFEICMQNVALAHQAQAEKHLLGVGPYSLEINAYIASEFLQDFTKIDAEILKYHA